MELSIAMFMVVLYMFFNSGNVANKITPAAKPNEPSIIRTEPVVQPAPAKPAERYETPLPVETSVSISPDIKSDTSLPTYSPISRDRTEAVIRKYNKYLSDQDITSIHQYTDQYCKEKNLDPRLMLGLMARESSFNPHSISSSGAKGLGQIMDFNMNSLGISDPFSIQQNIRGTVEYFSRKLLDFQGENMQLFLALAAYKEGSGTIKRANHNYSEHTAGYIDDILRIRASI